MNDTLSKVLWAVGTIVVAVLLAGMFGGAKVIQTLGATGAGITNLTGLSIDGASPGTLSVAQTITQSGVTQTIVRQALTSGTSTPCAIATPSATTTVEDFTMNITTATSSAITWEVGTSTTAYATTTTMLSAVPVGAGNQYTIAYAGVAGNVVSPSTYIVVGPTAATAAGTGAFTSIVLGGTCQATFISSN